jgi:hypothetical protein
MKLKKLKMLMDLEMMRLELIPFSVNVQSVIADWPEDRKRKFFRKFRKLARKACQQTAIREDKSYGTGSHTERKAWIKKRTDFLFSPPSTAYSSGLTPDYTGRTLQRWRFGRRRQVVENWIRREIWRKMLHEEHA